MPSPDVSHYAVLFRSRMRDDADMDAYLPLAARMVELVQTISGYISHKSYMAQDGERITISVFDSLDAIQEWKQHPEHLTAQQLGKTHFYQSYHVEVMRIERAYHFPL